MFRLVSGTITREAVEVDKDEPLKRELQSFVECSRRGIQPVVSGSEAAAALELAIEITEITRSATGELAREIGGG
jgi:predicted dehydrogenase